MANISPKEISPEYIFRRILCRRTKLVSIRENLKMRVIFQTHFYFHPRGGDLWEYGGGEKVDLANFWSTGWITSKSLNRSECHALHNYCGGNRRSPPLAPMDLRLCFRNSRLYICYFHMCLSFAGIKKRMGDGWSCYGFVKDAIEKQTRYRHASELAPKSLWGRPPWGPGSRRVCTTRARGVPAQNLYKFTVQTLPRALLTGRQSKKHALGPLLESSQSNPP